MKFIKFLDDHIEEVLIGALLGVTTLLTFLQVVMRYVMKDPLSWSEELSRYLNTWMIYIAVSYGVKKSAHIKVDVLLGIFPKALRKYVLMLADLIVITISLFIVVTGTQNAMKILSLGQKSPAMGIEMGYIYLAPVVGFVLTAIRAFQDLLKKVKPQKFEEANAEVNN